MRPGAALGGVNASVRRHGRRQGARALAALGAAALLALTAAGGAGAEQPPVGGFAGEVPAEAGLGPLVTTGEAAPAALAATLVQAGCDVESLSLLGSTPVIYVPGAPPFVNAAFPHTLAAETSFIVRCGRAGSPAVDAPNAAYALDGDIVRLAGGGSEVPVAPGSATMIVTALTDRRSYGDLDGDGAADAAVALWQQPGGSGTFHYLALLAGGAPGPAPTVLLGDRIIVERVVLAHGRVTVSYLDRTFDDSFAAAPTIPVTRRFVLEDGALVELGSGSCETPAADAIGAFVFVTAPASGTEVLGRFRVSGCSRTFESTVNWRLLDRSGAELAAGHTTGGGVDGVGRFTFTVEYDIDPKQIGHLEVFEIDASGGEGFPPPRNTIPLILG